MKAKGYAWILFFICLCLIGISVYLYIELGKKDLTIEKRDSSIVTLKEEKEELSNENFSLNREKNSLETNSSKLKMEKKFLEKEVEVLKSKITEIIQKLSTKDIEVLEKKVSNINTKTLNDFYVYFEKKKIYNSEDMPKQITILPSREKIILANKVRSNLKNLKESEILVIEGNADNLKFFKDIDNRKNSDLALQRAINSVMSYLSEEEKNKLHFKTNTKANDRDVKLFRYTYTIKEK